MNIITWILFEWQLINNKNLEENNKLIIECYNIYLLVIVKLWVYFFFFFNQDELLYTISETILSFKIECLKLNYYYHNLLLSSIQLNLEYKIK